MKKTTHKSSFAVAKEKITLCAMAAAMLAACPVNTQAQERGQDFTSGSGTISVETLPGIDPCDTITTTGMPQNDQNKIFCLYNAGAEKFLNIGGLWGTHASLNDSPYAIWFEATGTDGVYYLNNNVAGSGTGTYMGVMNNADLYMDKGSGSGNERARFVFEKAADYSEANKVYTIKVTAGQNNGGTFYVTAYPTNEAKYCNIEKSLYSTTDPRYTNQEWKIISKKEYYTLFLANPANMESSIDATFMIKAPSFRVNDTEMANWKLGTGQNPDLRFGDKTMYCTYANRGTIGAGHFNKYDGSHQRDYGKYFYCYSKGARGYYLYQDVQVHKAGWYILRCNGFSTSNSMENIKQNGMPLAHLFTAMLDAKGEPIRSTATASTLNVMSQSDANALEDAENGAGIGKAFFEGEYENQVQLCVDSAANGGEVSEQNPVTLRIGIYVDPTQKGASPATADEITAVDNFRLLYAGPRRNPELVLDEESTDLRYLSEANDEYKNSVLHLNRKLNDNVWNSLILPVNLTWGQMKRTFGDAVKVAKLAALTDNSVQFTTVEPSSDDEVMVRAFEPYIVYPPVVYTTSPAYTVEKFYTAEGDDNSRWLGKDYKESSDENDRLTKTIDENHYTITMVSFSKADFMQHVSTDSWISDTKFSGTGAQGTMECLGTMAKTYDEDGIISGRDNLNGDYFMYKGKLIQVPEGKNSIGEDYSYGLKAFRCWFELKDRTDGGAAKNVSLLIDGVEDSSTGISDIHTSNGQTSYKRGIDGVFNMDGQMIRHGSSTTNLPKGLYIVDGRKVVIG